MTASYLLSIIVFLPLAGGIGVLFLRRNPEACRWLSLGVALADLALIKVVYLTAPAAPSGGGFLLIEDHPWIEALGVRYSLTLDGISLLLTALAAFLGVLSILVSWKQIQERVALFHFFLLFMLTAVMGVFLATDLLLFYLFWELQLIPMLFLIGIWGHSKRIYATVKFVMFSMAGSPLMLIAILGLYLIHGAQTGHYTFALASLTGTPLSAWVEVFLYSAFLLAFAIKIPLFPVHTWLPDAHTEAPTAGSVILAGLLLKTGAYAVLRFAFPLFPRAAAESFPVLVAVGLTGIFYAAWIALAQKDMKRLVAYSSIAHMGLIVFGLALWNAITVSGAVLQMFNHGITTSALFIMVGMLDERTGTRQLADLGGIWKRMPVFSAFFLLFCMSTIGLPGLNNFVGEILILAGAFKARPAAAVLGFVGIVFGLIYGLRLVQDTLFGQPAKVHDLWDITGREAAILIPLALAMLFVGLYPGPVLDLLQAPVQDLLSVTNKALTAGAW
jgi:NADH-quinone oxidoreductase subunit M